MSISTAAKYLKLTWLVQKINIMSAMEYRASFMYQVVGMIINNTGLLLVWVIFFKKFPAINGWGIHETMLLYGVSTMSFALVWIFLFGSLFISSYIVKGQLDNYLLQPKNVLWSISVSRTDISAVGDFSFGILVFLISGYCTFASTIIFFLVGIISALIFYFLIVILQSISFYAGDFEKVSEDFVNALLGFTLYPQSIYKGILQIIIYTVIPAAFISLVPVELIKNFQLRILGLIIIVAIILFFLANYIFTRGLRRYESGNLINVKM